ncbi:MAG: hypothetical protein FJZ64_03690 [Chlamydiae bacterium]|nr:hypothetical protein [Chlamydiota bacterium]
MINPIFMFGAYFYTWVSLEKLSPTFAWITLINPIVYVLEGMRSAALGQEGHLPFWVCFFSLWGFIFVFASHAIYKLKRRLDCV